MCLVISKRDHFLSLLPKTAKEDIVVYKLLLYKFSRLITPFHCKEINFHNNKCILTANFTKRFSALHRGYIVEQGIHAFRCKETAEKELIHCPYPKILEAIIPTGTRYYIGKDGDIVSEKLIIFRNETALAEYQKKQRK